MSDPKLHFVSTVDEAPILNCLLRLVNICELLNTDRILRRESNLADSVTVHLAEVSVVKLGNIGDCLVFATTDASFVLASDPHISKLHRQSFKDDHTFAQNIFFAKSENYLHYFKSLELSNEARHHAKDASI